MNLIGIDYAIGGDTPMYSVMRKENGKFKLVDIGLIEDFDYTKYVASEYQLIGENFELDLFKRFMKGKYGNISFK